GGTIGLLPLRGRQRGIVGGLRRLLEPGQPLLQFGDPRQRRFQLPDQREDEGILLRGAQLAQVDLGRHPDVESSRPSSSQPRSRPIKPRPDQRVTCHPGEQLRSVWLVVYTYICSYTSASAPG